MLSVLMSVTLFFLRACPAGTVVTITSFLTTFNIITESNQDQNSIFLVACYATLHPAMSALLPFNLITRPENRGSPGPFAHHFAFRLATLRNCYNFAWYFLTSVLFKNDHKIKVLLCQFFVVTTRALPFIGKFQPTE